MSSVSEVSGLEAAALALVAFILAANGHLVPWSEEGDGRDGPPWVCPCGRGPIWYVVGIPSPRSAVLRTLVLGRGRWPEVVPGRVPVLGPDGMDAIPWSSSCAWFRRLLLYPLLPLACPSAGPVELAAPGVLPVASSVFVSVVPTLGVTTAVRFGSGLYLYVVRS